VGGPEDNADTYSAKASKAHQLVGEEEGPGAENGRGKENWSMTESVLGHTHE